MGQRDNWYQVDNVAKVFLATAGKRDTRTMRVDVTLTEPVDPVILQEAAELAALQRPQYQVYIRRGLFWHYMEETTDKPIVEEEHLRVAPSLYNKNDKHSLHYRVSYYNNRINLDMFHALTDGTGAMEYLNIILQNYLQLKHPGELDNIALDSGASNDDLSEDSFKHNYDKKIKDTTPPSPKKVKSYHIKGLLLPYDQEQFFEVHMSASEVLKMAKENHATMTSFLGAKLMEAIYKDMPHGMKKRPITVSMPVNLRNFFTSGTSRNFFNSIYITHVFDGNETTADLAAEVDAKLKAELEPEKVAARMSNYEKMEQLMFVRLVPLFLKNPGVAIGSASEKSKVTAVISNLGKLKLPDEVSKYVENYSAYCSSSNFFVTVSSYGDVLTLGISSIYRNTTVLKNFLKSFTDAGIDVTVYATEVVR